jgi:hypothetical protein
MVSIGRLGSGADLWQSLSEAYGREFRFVRLGEHAPQRIAQVLQAIDFGVATTPYALIGKSATVAAMVEHGLPVIVNRDDVEFAGYCAERSPVSSQIVKMDEQLVDTLPGLTRRAPHFLLPQVAQRFLADLSEPANARCQLAAA